MTPLEIKMLSSPGTFSGYASTYGVDCQRDQIMPGAFRHTLNTKRPLLLWHHRLHEPIGKWTYLSEDKQGLYVEGQLILEIQRAQEAYALMKKQILRSLSIGFQPVLSFFDKRKRVRKIYQLNLIEISIVGLPANNHAQIRCVKESGRNKSF